VRVRNVRPRTINAPANDSVTVRGSGDMSVVELLVRLFSVAVAACLIDLDFPGHQLILESKIRATNFKRDKRGRLELYKVQFDVG
jgi:hypothetical protein